VCTFRACIHAHACTHTRVVPFRNKTRIRSGVWLQAAAARRERQAAELADMFRLLGEVDELAKSMERQTSDTRKMMQVGYAHKPKRVHRGAGRAAGAQGGERSGS
jgi:hypothetical protein